jgi:Zn-dependent protease with chaperone function
MLTSIAMRGGEVKSMDFFQRQDIARKQSRTLIVYMVLAVVGIIVAIYLIVAVTLAMIQAKQTARTRGIQRTPFKLWDPSLFLGVAAVTGAVIFCGMMHKQAQLSRGGGPLAMSLGGKRVPQHTKDPAERRLLNVVEEMSIASGTPMPAVYLLHEENSINAFAAGNSPTDAVIGVTRGAIEQLSRDELQGVIAHEFSHILNGDMRLNLRLIGTLSGILMLATIGYYMLRAGSRDRKGGQIAIIGLVVMIVGYIGLFFGRLIKGAVSRQREFLADASAVQFTRNPQGIGGALLKVGGLSQRGTISSPEAEEASHLFFSDGLTRRLGQTSTHPALGERVKRILPDWSGTFPKVVAKNKTDAADQTATHRDQERAERLARLQRTPAGALLGTVIPTQHQHSPLALTPLIALASIGAPGAEHVAWSTALRDQLPDALIEALHDPFSARAVILASLLDREDQAIRAKQLSQLDLLTEPGTRQEAERLAELMQPLGIQAALPIADLAMPALGELSPEQHERFKQAALELIHADGRVSLFEFVVQRLLQQLERQRSGQRISTRYHSIKPVLEHTATLLSALAYAGSNDHSQASAAFAAAVRTLQAEHLTLGDPTSCQLEQVSQALDTLAQTAPAIKRRLLHAATTAVAHDGVATVAEGELLRAVAAALDSPMPPLLGTAATTPPTP